MTEIASCAPRHRQTGTQLWGVQFARGVRRKNETSHLTLVPIAAQPGTFRVSAGATLVGLETPAGSTRFEVKPYGIGSSSTDLTADAPFSNKGDGDFGVDAKYGITQNVIADFTYNTDFAQVEVTSNRSTSPDSVCSFPRNGSSFSKAVASSTSGPVHRF